MLEAQYKRDLNHNYLVFPQKKDPQDFRIQMLNHQKAEELLPCMMRRVNGELLITYEISGLQSLRQLFEKRDMKARDLQRLVEALSGAMEHLKEYLLDMEMLVLEPDYIFVEENTGNYFFCCSVNMERSVFESFHGLCEYILSVLDHKDQEAVRLGYSLYRNTMEDNFSLMQMLKEPVSPEAAPLKPVALESAVSKAACPEPASPKVIPEKTDIPKPDMKPAAKKKGFFKNKKTDKEKKKREEYRQNPLPSYAGEQMFSYGGSSCILQGTNRQQLFILNTYPYLLGSLECGVDGYIEEPKVSHFHARIDKKQESYYITDLHSDHGTFVNRERIPPESPVEVRFGDVIELGNAAYVFLNKNNGK